MTKCGDKKLRKRYKSQQQQHSTVWHMNAKYSEDICYYLNKCTAIKTITYGCGMLLTENHAHFAHHHTARKHLMYNYTKLNNDWGNPTLHDSKAMTTDTKYTRQR